MNAVAAAASATDSVVYSCPAANASGSVWSSTVVSASWRRSIVLAVPNALSVTNAISTMPLTRMRPGVVVQNHQRGWAGSTAACERGWLRRRMRQLHGHRCVPFMRTFRAQSMSEF